METVINPHKISFTVDDPSETYSKMVKRVCEHSSTSLKQYTTLPNHTCYYMEPPSGAVLLFDSKGPFTLDPFCNDMFKGTTIKEIDPLNEQTLQRQELLQKLHEAIPEHSPKPATLASDSRNFDVEPWVASLGDRRSYIGLFTARSKDKTTMQWIQKWFLVCHAGIDHQTYLEFEEHLAQCENNGKTFTEVFDSDRIVSRFRTLCRRNRRRLICKAAQALGIDIGSRKDAHAVTADPPPTIASTDLETESNTIKSMGTYHAFYNASCNTEDAKGGVIINRAPQLGPIVCRGPPTSTNAKSFFNGGTWSNDLYNAFPTEMGLNSSLDNQMRTYPNVFISEGGKDPECLKAGFRKRDRKWMDMEERLGYLSSKWGEPIELQPYIVKLTQK